MQVIDVWNFLICTYYTTQQTTYLLVGIYNYIVPTTRLFGAILRCGIAAKSVRVCLIKLQPKEEEVEAAAFASLSMYKGFLIIGNFDYREFAMPGLSKHLMNWIFEE